MNCNGRNHFKAKCRTKVHSLEQTNCDSEPVVPSNSTQMMMGSMSYTKKGRVTALMHVNGYDVRFQLDSEADVNIICAKFVKKNKIYSLTMWNGSTMKPLGEAVLNVSNPKAITSTPVRFMVVDNNFTCLLGVDTIQELGLITVNTHNNNNGFLYSAVLQPTARLTALYIVITYRYTRSNIAFEIK